MKKNLKPVPPSIEQRLQEYKDCDSIHHQDKVVALFESMGFHGSAQAIRENKDRMIRELFPDIYNLVTESSKNPTSQIEPEPK